jgi:hypothetical protein
MHIDQLKRREFITLLGGAAVAWPLAARAQQGERMRRIGVLMNASANAKQQANLATFRQVLQQLGWTDGRNVRSNGPIAAVPAARMISGASAANSPACLRISRASPPAHRVSIPIVFNLATLFAATH